MSCGPSGRQLTSTFKSKTDTAMHDDLGKVCQLVVFVCATTPHLMATQSSNVKGLPHMNWYDLGCW